MYATQSFVLASYRRFDGLKPLGIAGFLLTMIGMILLGCQRETVEAEGRDRVILLGIDGLDPNYLTDSSTLAQCPTLERLLREGAWGTVEANPPFLSPLIWTTIATGRDADVHGILDFAVYQEQGGDPQLTPGNFRQVAALWNVASDRGIKSAIVGWWATWPAETIEGVMVSDRFVHTQFAPDPLVHQALGGMTSPEEWQERLESFRVSWRDIDAWAEDLPPELETVPRTCAEQGAPTLESAEGAFVLGGAAVESYHRMALHLWEVIQPELLAVYLPSLDLLCHKCAPLATGDAEPDRLHQAMVKYFYSYMDRVVADYVERMDDRTTLVVLSDHGFHLESELLEEGPLRFEDDIEWHQPRGITLFYGANVVSSTRFPARAMLDVFPTLATLLGLPIAEDLPGKVIDEAVVPGIQVKAETKRVARYAQRPAPPRLLQEIPGGQEVLKQLQALGYLSDSPSRVKSVTNLKRLPIWMRELPDGYTYGVNAYVNLGQLYQHRGDLPRAREAFEAAVWIDPEFAKGHSNLGSLARELGDLSTAEEHLRRAVALAPDIGSFRYNLGNLLLAQGNLQEAMECYERAINLNPTSGRFYTNRAYVHQLRKQPELAEQDYLHALRLEPDNVRAHMNLGALYFTQKRLQEAQKHFERTVELAPDSVDALNNLGILYAMQNQLERALDCWKRSLALQPHDNRVTEYIAEAERRLNRKR